MSPDQSTPPPPLPPPRPGPRVTVQNEKIDVDLRRPGDHPPPSKRSNALLGELREAVRDFANSFDPRTNVHSQLRNVLKRYRDQVDLDDPDVDVVFALGLRLENSWLSAKRAISERFEPELEDAQQETLLSVTRIHAVFIASDPDGVELLQAADRYAYKPAEDERFKARAEPVIERFDRENLATERLFEILKSAIEEMNQGEHPARTGLIGRNFVQSALLMLAQLAISGIVGTTAGQIFIHSGVGQHVIAAGAPLADKAIAFFLDNAQSLGALAAVGNEGFAFLNAVSEWIKIRLDIR